MADEMLRVTRPGGIVFLCYTVWFGPGAATRPRPGTTSAATRARRRYRAPARPRAEEQVRRVAVRRSRCGPALALGAAPAGGEVLDVLPRYNPRWARWLLRVPGAA